MLRKTYFEEKPLPRRVAELLQQSSESYDLERIAKLTDSTVEDIKPIIEKYLDAGVIANIGTEDSPQYTVSSMGKGIAKK